jgi:hypothetical protein
VIVSAVVAARKDQKHLVLAMVEDAGGSTTISFDPNCRPNLATMMKGKVAYCGWCKSGRRYARDQWSLCLAQRGGLGEG